MRICITNAFSLSMLKPTEWNLLSIRELTDKEARDIVMNKNYSIDSAVGHESTAYIISKLLGIEVPAHRKMVNLMQYDGILVFQLMVRLPEGKIMNIEEIEMIPHKWYIVYTWGSGDMATAERFLRAIYECA